MPDVADTVEPPVKKPLPLRRLRIAWTVFFAVLTVALCVLWVRSYKQADLLLYFVSIGKSPAALSVRGETIVGSLPTSRNIKPKSNWKLYSTPEYPGYVELLPHILADKRLALFAAGRNWFNPIWIQLPHWVWAVITALVGVVPWLPFRFSLRTMLIATTLVAVVLGVIALSRS